MLHGSSSQDMAHLSAELEAATSKLREDLQGQLWEYYGALKGGSGQSLKERIDRIEDKLEDLHGLDAASTTFSYGDKPGLTAATLMEREAEMSRVASLAGRVSNLEKRMADQADRQTRELEAMAKERVQHFSLLKSRLERQETAQSELARVVETVDSAQAGMKAEVEAQLKSQLEVHERRLKASLDQEQRHQAEERTALKETLMQLFTGLGHEVSSLRQQVTNDIQLLQQKTSSLEEQLQAEKSGRREKEEALEKCLDEEISALKREASQSRNQLEDKLAVCQDQFQESLAAERRARERAEQQTRDHTKELEEEVRRCEESVRQEKAERRNQVEDLMSKFSRQEEAQAAELVKVGQRVVLLEKYFAETTAATKAELLQDIGNNVAQLRNEQAASVTQLQHEMKQVAEQIQQKLQLQVNAQLQKLQQQLQQQLQTQDALLQQSMHQQLEMLSSSMQQEDQELRRSIEKAAAESHKATKALQEETEDGLKSLREGQEDAARRLDVRLEELKAKLVPREHLKEDEDVLREEMRRGVEDMRRNLESEQRARANLEATLREEIQKHSVQESLGSDMRALKDGIDTIKSSMEASRHSPPRPEERHINDSHGFEMSAAQVPVNATFPSLGPAVAPSWLQGHGLRPGAMTPPPSSPAAATAVVSFPRSMSVGSGLCIQSQPASPLNAGGMRPLLRSTLPTTTAQCGVSASPTSPGTVLTLSPCGSMKSLGPVCRRLRSLLTDQPCQRRKAPATPVGLQASGTRCWREEQRLQRLQLSWSAALLRSAYQLSLESTSWCPESGRAVCRSGN
eukprot:TRINITY_DN6868_c0_g1_i3.p1 TRINITY_DN6868_c0_g1~~TRINITY_DN6868_c0_g1_i3.p1  ORF type:complete len:801 (+),score=240.28 TRINITY_DN6868_c0_g1_i3:101-2503(+)